MTTNNAINANAGSPLPVADGGTNVNNIAAYSIISGNPTGTGIATLSTGTSGQLLQSAGAASLATFTASTYPSTVATNQFLYSTSLNTVVGISIATALTNLGFTISNIGSGYYVLPGGLYLQWVSGASSSTGGGVQTNFPITFPTACFGVIGTPTSGATAFQISFTTAHFTIAVVAGTPGFSIFAIGN